MISAIQFFIPMENAITHVMNTLPLKKKILCKLNLSRYQQCKRKFENRWSNYKIFLMQSIGAKQTMDFLKILTLTEHPISITLSQALGKIAQQNVITAFSVVYQNKNLINTINIIVFKICIQHYQINQNIEIYKIQNG